MARTIEDGPTAPVAGRTPGPAEPNLTMRTPGGAAVTGVVLLLHGGQDDSFEPVPPWSLAVARMRMFISPLLTRSAGKGVAVALLRDRLQGWNGEAADAAADAQWALEQIADRYGPVPVAVIGHSMGGRAALRVGGHPSVTGIAAMAPWVPDDPVEHLVGRTVMIAHGDLDRTVSPAESLAFARRARQAGVQVCRLRVEGGGHAMLGRLADWNILAAEFALAMVGAKPLPEPVVAAFAEQEAALAAAVAVVGAESAESGESVGAQAAQAADAESAAGLRADVDADFALGVGADVDVDVDVEPDTDTDAVADTVADADADVDAGGDSEADVAAEAAMSVQSAESAEPAASAESAEAAGAEAKERIELAGLDMPLSRDWRRRWH
ncbi:MAG TPA: hypothetical protein VGX23_21150 [Actinocrinis sp.]|nr:hypothetical protein [Actinocrinis sp.]